MKFFFYLAFILSVLISCHQRQDERLPDVHGHRGARGLYPENSIPGFLYAASIGVDYLELDVVISADGSVIVSHDPVVLPSICDTGDTESEVRIYAIDYDSLMTYDCGSGGNMRFPDQKKMAVYKPKLSSVFEDVARYCDRENLPQPRYNIEPKSTPEGDGLYHPEIDVFANKVMGVVDAAGLRDRIILQSFDVRMLNYVGDHYPDVKLALLVDSGESIEDKLAALIQKPSVISPYFRLLDRDKVMMLQSRNFEVVPWTVNSPEDIAAIRQMGVDGIISDYPDRLMDHP